MTVSRNHPALRLRRGRNPQGSGGPAAAARLHLPTPKQAITYLPRHPLRGSFGWINNIMRTAARLAVKDGQRVTPEIIRAVRHHTVGLPT